MSTRRPSVPSAGLGARLVLWHWRHGAWLLLVLALLGSALVAAGAAWRARQEAAAWAARLALPPPAAASAARPGPSSDALALQALQRVLPPLADHAAQVRELVRLTQPGLAWQQADFQQRRLPGLAIVRLQITVPISGDYEQVRRALDRALLDMPALSLDQLTLRRLRVSDTTLDTQLRLSIWLRDGDSLLDGDRP